jgi:hypothetical protein
LEKVTPTTFYYWDKRVRQEASKTMELPLGRVQSHTGRKHCRSSKSMAERRMQPASAGHVVAADRGQGLSGQRLTSDDPRVHFVWNSKLEVSVPAHCVEALHCILECCARETADDSRHGAGRAGAFQEILVGSR